MEPVPHRCLLQYNTAGVSVKLKRVKDVRLKLFTAPFVILAIGYLMGFVAFLWERWTGQLVGHPVTQTVNSDRKLKRQNVQETRGPTTNEPTTPKVEKNATEVLEAGPNVPKSQDIATNDPNANDNPPSPNNSVWMDEMKKDKNTKRVELKVRFQIQEPDFSSRIKGTLIKEKPVFLK
jgi:hypothetical protein